jgi:hypothetical protein
MWSKASAVGNAAAQRRVVHGRNRCAEGASIAVATVFKVKLFLGSARALQRPT